MGASLPDHLIADAEVPVLTGVQFQGDIGIIPAETDPFAAEHVTLLPVPDKGIQAVTGEATGNTHWLHRGFDSPGVLFGRVAHELVIGVVSVPVGQTAELIHTDEHGANAMGPGLYVLRGKRELADEIRRVQD
ncbi:hypothetical protein A7G45_00010 [Mycolicibacterium llatzerense]|nr:hypothetical protein [Mycolicibacterium llatzerense]